MGYDPPFRFTLAHFLALVGGISVIFAVGRATGSPFIVIQLFMLLVGWIVRRFTHAHLGGVILSLAGLDILTCGGISWAYYGIADSWGIRDFFLGIGSLLVIAGSSVLLGTSSERRFWRYQKWLGIFILVVLIGWWVTIPAVGNLAMAQRRAYETTANRTAMSKAVAQVETIRKQLGHVPVESELVRLLDESFPSVRNDDYESAIHFQRLSDNRYQLHYTIKWGDFFLYDSAKPQKGWCFVRF